MNATQESTRTTTQFSVTVNTTLVKAADALLKPTGMLTLPKGTYSRLFSELLGEWLSKHLEADLLDIIGWIHEHPNASGEELKAAMQKLKTARPQQVEA